MNFFIIIMLGTYSVICLIFLVFNLFQQRLLINQLVATTEMVRGGAIDDLFDTPTSAVRGGNNIKSKPPHAVVHMGILKTGSTTIQYQSAAMKDNLKMDGYEMPWSAMRERLVGDYGENQLKFALCFLNIKHDDKTCSPDLLQEGADISYRNHNLFVSAEHFSYIEKYGIDELADYLSQWQKQTIVIFYRRYFDWIVSMYVEGSKNRKLEDSIRWERSILDYVSDHISKVPMEYVYNLDKRLQDKFDNINILNFHDKSKGGPDRTLFCDRSLDMTHTCKAIQNEKKERRSLLLSSSNP